MAVGDRRGLQCVLAVEDYVRQAEACKLKVAEFCYGQEPQGMFENTTIITSENAEMHRNKRIHNDKFKGQKVLVRTHTLLNRQRGCKLELPKISDLCVFGQVRKNMGWAEVDLPLKFAAKFANPWQVARCQLPQYVCERFLGLETNATAGYILLLWYSIMLHNIMSYLISF